MILKVILGSINKIRFKTFRPKFQKNQKVLKSLSPHNLYFQKV